MRDVAILQCEITAFVNMVLGLQFTFRLSGEVFNMQLAVSFLWYQAGLTHLLSGWRGIKKSVSCLQQYVIHLESALVFLISDQGGHPSGRSCQCVVMAFIYQAFVCLLSSIWR